MTNEPNDIPQFQSPLEEAVFYGDDEYIEEYQRKWARKIEKEKEKKESNPYR